MKTDNDINQMSPSGRYRRQFAYARDIPLPTVLDSIRVLMALLR